MVSSSIGKKALTKTIDIGVDVLVSTLESAVTNKAETGEFDIWKSFTGGLLEATISGVLPLKYVDKLEKKLAKKMKISATRMNRYKSRMITDGNRSRSTQSRNRRLFDKNKANNENYTKAFIGVKTVNDAYKSLGAEVLQSIDLYKITPSRKRATIEVGQVDAGEIIK
ncbi:hypothetical protein [Pedobacter terrae]|uniref:hypothetical protein n=1 Tax=Pedobacter terrae TaxID=405671 RepID=UPI002FF61787